MKPAKIANPPASTPNTPDARSPSVKKLPSGALRRTRSIAVIVATLATTRMTAAKRRLMRSAPCSEHREPVVHSPPPSAIASTATVTARTTIVVLAGCHLDAVRVTDAEPPLGDLRDLSSHRPRSRTRDRRCCPAPAGTPVGDLHVEARAQWSYHRLRYRRDPSPSSDPRSPYVPHSNGPASWILHQQRHPIQILEHHCLTDAQRLAVDLEGAAARLVVDPEVAADRQQLLAHLVPVASPRAPNEPRSSRRSSLRLRTSSAS